MMAANSYIFFGLLVVPLLIFLIWVIRQDRNRSYWGILLLIAGIILAIYSIMTLDKKFTQPGQQEVPKASSFR